MIANQNRTSMAQILIIDDDVSFCLMIRTLLEKNQYKVTSIFSPVEGLKAIKENFYNVVLSDMRMPEMTGLELIAPIKKYSPQTQIILMTSYAEITTAIKAIKQGAFDYISKPLNPEELLSLIKDALVSADQKQSGPSKNTSHDYFEGVSEQSRQLKEIISIVAPTPMSVLLVGESGTGKEYIARLIHEKSPRKNSPFIAVDCGAIPKELAASEFFGHIRGSFTGAIADKTGYFESANGGTLFLDEIGNLSYDTQIQLLRALQESVIKPVGASKSVKVNIRVITATNEDLSEAMEKGNFRKDLYHRLNEFQISAPALRNRKQDIMHFARHFLKQANHYLNKDIEGFDPEVQEVFLKYSWPGNLRELKNIVKRATLLSKTTQISLPEIPEELQKSQVFIESASKNSTVNEAEKIVKALESARFNKSRAARILNIDRKTLYNKLKLYQIKAQ